ncbi:hypothetical protein [Streptomyces sp. NPDC051162]|uniref:hypothetical protein n=1 Tax=unclassified Streptomyces TaxID=2593676 RepID=UPI0034321863
MSCVTSRAHCAHSTGALCSHSVLLSRRPFEATTREQENAAQQLAIPVFGCWLAAGLTLFLILGMPRALLSHLTTMFLPPSALTLLLLVL